MLPPIVFSCQPHTLLGKPDVAACASEDSAYPSWHPCLGIECTSPLVFACAVSTGVEAGEGRDITCICDRPHIIAIEVCVL